MESCNIRVVVRIRPFLGDEKEEESIHAPLKVGQDGKSIE